MDTLNRGPYVAAGSSMDNRVEPFDGPSLHYQGAGFPDVRFGPIPKDTSSPSSTPSWFNGGKVCMVDAIPSASVSGLIAAAQAPSTTAGVPLGLVTSVAATAVGVGVWTYGVGILPAGATTPVTVGAIDFGFATASTVANSSTVQVFDSTQFHVGQWIVIGGAASASNAALYAKVASVATINNTTIYITPVAGSTIVNAPVGQGNVYSNLFPASPGASIGPQNVSANAVEPCFHGGFAKMYDPRQMMARNVIIASPNTASGTGTFLVTGYDVYNQLMHELIAATAGTGGIGLKAFKYISSITTVTAATTGTPANVAVGPGDSVGFHFAVNKAEYLEVWYGGLNVVNSTAGFVQALQPNVATTANNTSADVRGTQNISATLPGTSGLAGQIAGNKRVVMFYTPPMSDMVAATPINSQPLYGFPQP